MKQAASPSRSIPYVAFLRGINVSGQKIIKMTDLAEMFRAMKLNNVRTYIQSGNVIFESPEPDKNKLGLKIEKGLGKALGYEVPVLLRSKMELEEIVQQNVFRKAPEDSKPYITFLGAGPLKKTLNPPLFSPKKDVQVIGISGLNVFSLSLSVNGSYGFPNAFLEKELGVPATTRNLNTLIKVIG